MRAILWDKPKCEVYVDLADANQSGEVELGVSAEIIAKSVKVWWFRIKNTNGVINCYSNYVIDEENDKITILTGEETNYEITGNIFKASEGSSPSIDTDSIAPEFDPEETYTCGQVVYKDGKLYNFPFGHTGAWSDDAIEVDVMNPDVCFKEIIETFATENSYDTGDYVSYNNKVYRFTADHTGAWSDSDVENIPISELSAIKGNKNYVRAYIRAREGGSPGNPAPYIYLGDIAELTGMVYAGWNVVISKEDSTPARITLDSILTGSGVEISEISIDIGLNKMDFIYADITNDESTEAIYLTSYSLTPYESNP